MELYDELVGLVDALERAQIDYALCGGIAVAIHGYPRFTKDIDLLIRETDLTDVLKRVAERGFTIDGGRLPFQPGTEVERAVYRVSKAEGDELLTLELVLVTPVFEDVWTERDHFEWSGRRIRVVSRKGLAVMKRLAGKDQDLLDLRKLEEGDETDAE